MRAAAILTLCVMLSGCVTTLQDLRDQPAIRAGSAPGNYLALASCTMDGLETDGRTSSIGYRILDLAPTRRASVLGSISGLILNPAPAPVIELTFLQRNGATTIETRTASGPGGWGYYGGTVEKRAWPIIERCAGATVAVSPPVE